jgi:hypothetical protein
MRKQRFLRVKVLAKHWSSASQCIAAPSGARGMKSAGRVRIWPLHGRRRARLRQAHREAADGGGPQAAEVGHRDGSLIRTGSHLWPYLGRDVGWAPGLIVRWWRVSPG